MNRHLFELQQIDDTITAFKRERSKLDDGGAARSARDTLEKVVESEKAELNRINTERADKELHLQTTEEKIARQQSRLMNAKNTHEVNSLQRDINALTRARGDLDEAVLILMDEAESCANRLRDLQHEKDAKAAETARIEEHFAAETTRIDAALDEAMQRRREAASQLSAEEAGKYNDSAKRFHGVAVAHNQDGNCSACGNALTPFSLKEARTKEWPTCENCGRLLWVEH